jgi:hypothetical protein
MVFFKPTTHPSYEGLPIESLFFNSSSFMRNDDTNNTRLDKEKNQNQKLQIKETNKIKPKGNFKDKAETKEKEQE